VRGSAPVSYQVRASAHGPLISDAQPELLAMAVPKSSGGGTYALALAMTGLKPSKPGWYFELQTARNWDEFRAALRHYSGPAFNFVYADANGHVGYQLAARVPMRAGNPSNRPVNGWAGGQNWVGEAEFDSLPHDLDPPQGWFATANSRISAPRSALYLSTRWADLSWRVGRIADLLQQSTPVSMDTMRTIQLDVYQASMKDTVAWLRMANESDKNSQHIQQAIASWDLRAKTGSYAQTLTEAFLVELMREVFKPYLSARLLELYIAMPVFSSPALTRIMNDDRAEFFGREPESAQKLRRAAVERAAGAAIKALADKFGASEGEWTWSRVHTLTFRSPLGQGKGWLSLRLGRMFDVGPFGMPGSNTTINAAAWNPSNWFEVTYGVGYRQVIDLEDLSRSQWLPPPPGQSEHPASPFYSNLAEPAERGGYFPMLWQRADVWADAKSTLTLIP